MNDRKATLGELKELLTKKGGNYFSGYLNKIRESAIAKVPEKDKLALSYLTGEIKGIDLAKLPRAEGPGVVWTVDSALEVLNQRTPALAQFCQRQENVLRWISVWPVTASEMKGAELAPI